MNIPDVTDSPKAPATSTPASGSDAGVETWEYPVNLAMAIGGIAIMLYQNWQFACGLALFLEAGKWAKDMKKREHQNVPMSGTPKN